MTIIEIRKLKVGQIGFVIWPEVDPYSIYKQEFDFDDQNFRILRVRICDRVKSTISIDNIPVEGWNYKVCLADEKDADIFSGFDGERKWDRPFHFGDFDFIGETRNEAIREACRKNNVMLGGFMGIARKLEALIDSKEKIGCYNPKGRLL